jgi:hypothetical protein
MHVVAAYAALLLEKRGLMMLAFDYFRGDTGKKKKKNISSRCLTLLSLACLLNTSPLYSTDRQLQVVICSVASLT